MLLKNICSDAPSGSSHWWHAPQLHAIDIARIQITMPTTRAYISSINLKHNTCVTHGYLGEGVYVNKQLSRRNYWYHVNMAIKSIVRLTLPALSVMCMTKPRSDPQLCLMQASDSKGRTHTIFIRDLFQCKDRNSRYGKIRPPWDVFIFTMEIVWLVRRHIYITYPCLKLSAIIIIIIVYFPENYRLVHMLHTRKSYVNIVYKCNRRDGCQRNRKFIIAGRNIE